MTVDVGTNVAGEIETALRRWRTRILDVILGLGCLVGLPAVGMIIPDFVRDPQNWPVLALLGLYLLLVGLAIFHRLDTRLRGWGMLFCRRQWARN